VADNYLWVITIPLNVSATTVTSPLDWTNVANPIRAIAYNGANGANGTDGTDGTNGSNGSATFIVTRTANDSSPPSNAEVIAVIGRNPVAGDIVTVSYNSGNNAVVYRFTTNWVTQATYITGSLIVSNTITGDKVAANTITGTNIAATTITAANIAANTITATQIAANTITANEIAAATISAANMAANSITASNAAIADAAITTAKIANLQVNTLQIANNAVSYSSGANSSGSGANTTVFMNAGDKVFVSAFVTAANSGAGTFAARVATLSQNGNVFESSQTIGFAAGPFLDIVYPPIPIAGIYTATSSGNVTFQIDYNQAGGGATGIFLTGLKK
jgi:hypothetical protein